MKIILLLHLCISTTVGQTTTCTNFQTIQGAFRGEYRGDSTGPAETLQDCVTRRCYRQDREDGKWKCQPGCAVSYHTNSENCLLLELKSQIIEWAKSIDQVFHDQVGWITAYIAQERPLAAPAVLHTHDNGARGLNLGYKGGRLDSSENGVKYESRFTKGNYAVGDLYHGSIEGKSNYISFLHGGEYILKTEPPFTLAAWMAIKNPTMGKQYYIWKGHPGNFHFYVLMSKAGRRMVEVTMNLRVTDTMIISAPSTIKKRLRKMFYHYAVAVANRTHATFYYDGEKVDIDYVEKSGYTKISPSDYVTLFSGESVDSSVMTESNFEKITFACSAFYESVLTKQQVNDLMNYCP